MPEPVRVRDNVTKHEYSTYGAYEGLTVLDEDATDVHGDLLPPKYPDAPEEDAQQATEPDDAPPPVTAPAAAAKKAAAAPRTNTSGREANTEES